MAAIQQVFIYIFSIFFYGWYSTAQAINNVKMNDVAAPRKKKNEMEICVEIHK